MRKLIVLTTALLLSMPAFAGEKKFMHCFAFTVRPEATEADWKAFATATDALPTKIKGLSKVWHGPLLTPQGKPGSLTQYQPADADTAKAFRSQVTGAGAFNKVLRQHMACMEFASAEAFKEYDADPPAHKDWAAVYDKVRVPGTTTTNFMGE